MGSSDMRAALRTSQPAIENRCRTSRSVSPACIGASRGGRANPYSSIVAPGLATPDTFPNVTVALIGGHRVQAAEVQDQVERAFHTELLKAGDITFDEGRIYAGCRRPAARQRNRLRDDVHGRDRPAVLRQIDAIGTRAAA